MMLIHAQDIINVQGAKISVLEGEKLPFSIKRVYYIHNVQVGATRGFHAHKTLEQLLMSIGGRIDVELDDGLGNKELYILDSPVKVLYVGPSFWRTMTWRSESLLMALASWEYEPDDYIRNYEEFLTFVVMNKGKAND
jgi:hypothetical protein